MTMDGRIGILGGRFDPIHLGHLAAASAARRRFALDQVLLLPSRVSPHRGGPAGAPDNDRLTMVRLAADGETGLSPCDIEMRSAAPSYTSETLARLGERGFHPAQLYCIVGTDAFAEIAAWHNYPAVLGQAHFVVVARPEHPVCTLTTRLPDLRVRMRPVPDDGTGILDPESAPVIWLLDAATPAVSSTLVRHRLATGMSIADLVPATVAAYITHHRLYETKPGSELA